MRYPKDAEVLFLMCDDVRREEHNKFTLVGVSTAGRTHIDGAKAGKDEVVAIPRISFFFAISGGEGKFAVRLRILYPDGTLVSEENAGDFDKSLDSAINLILTASPFVVREFGEYTVELYLDKEKFTRKFHLLGPPAGPAAN